ncbi:MAG: hypothetical protein WBG82_12985 [Parvibaculum sp.]|uniref:hypothetical protein n=1 Tax=Parvibaculum sp. TaxID=2024848 RepID=UPI003C76E42D
MSALIYMKQGMAPRWLMGLAVLSSVTLAPAIALAEAGQNKQAWQFPQTDGLTMAAIQRQATNPASSTIAGGSGTTLVCGGGGTGGATATSNSSCIIVNNSTGQIDVGQDSKGNQSASNSAQTTTNNNNLSDALSSLAP